MRTKLFLSTLLTGLLLSGCQPGDNTPGDASTKKEASGWYMRTTVEAQAADGKVYTHKSAGVFGMLEESSNEKDSHDIEAFGSASIYVVFVKDAWGEDNGDYFSDYRHYAKEEGMTHRVWTFQIKTAEPNLNDASFKISLKGPYDVFKKTDSVGYEEKQNSQSTLKNNLTLVDADNDQQYSASEVETLQFNMQGSKARTFRWVFGTVEPADYEDLTPAAVNSSLQMKSNTEEREAETKFGFPPVP